MTSALLLIAAVTLFSRKSVGVVQVSEESLASRKTQSRGSRDSRESRILLAQGSHKSHTPSVIESQIIPFVRSGGTAIVPVRDAFRCKLLRLRDEDVVPREKFG